MVHTMVSSSGSFLSDHRVVLRGGPWQSDVCGGSARVRASRPRPSLSFHVSTPKEPGATRTAVCEILSGSSRRTFGGMLAQLVCRGDALVRKPSRESTLTRASRELGLVGGHPSRISVASSTWLSPCSAMNSRARNGLGSSRRRQTCTDNIDARSVGGIDQPDAFFFFFGDVPGRGRIKNPRGPHVD